MTTGKMFNSKTRKVDTIPKKVDTELMELVTELKRRLKNGDSGAEKAINWGT